jgi:hypothetical protein
MAQLPLELLWHDTADKPLVLRRDVQSLVYLLSKAATPQVNLATRNWPFKVLIVRANPPDLGGQVPEVGKLKTHILDKGLHYGQDMVQVEVISQEAGIDRPATWAAVKDHLKTTSDYNVLVYLGHGELLPAHTGGQPIGQVFLETEDGGGHEPVSAPQLAKLLALYPIPVVVLTGCLTGAEAPGVPARKRGGEQGVAQALVNSSEAGVQVAIGMRTELRTNAAMTFLKAFFESLLSKDIKQAGNIDRAVWMARNELFLDATFPPSWAAPVVLRASEQEPMIPYLAQRITFPISAEMQKLLDIRAVLWKHLPGTKTALVDVELKLRDEGLKHGPLLLPRELTLAPNTAGQTAIDVAGTLTVSKLTGRLTVSGEGMEVQSLSATQALLDAGFRLLTDAADRSLFMLESKTGAAKALPEGEILRADIVVGAAAPGLYPIALDVQRTDPAVVCWPGDTMLTVPKP